MKLAILGTDEEIVQLLAAALSEGHEIVWLGDVRTVDAEKIRTSVPGLDDLAAAWELLLDREIADAVLVGLGNASSELRAEQLKRLVTESVPVLVVHPIGESVLTYYELDMVRRETGAVLQHYNPLATHPILCDLNAWVRDGHPEVGRIHQLICERRVDSATRANVLADLARDIELIAAIAGNIRRVSAIGPGAGTDSFASLQAQMTADKASSLRWSVGSRANLGTSLETTLLGDRGAVTLRIGNQGTDSDVEWQLETSTNGSSDSQILAPHDASLAAMQRFSTAAADSRTNRIGTASTWDAATRALEVVDAVTLSLEKGRTIDVFQQQLTERLAFRGTMAAIGCGVLLAGFAVIVLVTLLGGIEGAAGKRLVPYWSAALLAMLAFFLLLQVVPLLAAKPKHRDKDLE